jgi:hypothetical protein
MRRLFCAITMLMIAPAALAAPCARDGDGIVAYVKSAPTCRAAMAHFRQCALGTSGDIELGSAVERRCDASIPASARGAYERQQAACTIKYSHRLGTMYRSLEALCRASLAARYAR